MLTPGLYVYMSVRIHGTDSLGAFPDLHTNPAFGYEDPESPSAIVTPKRAPVGELPDALTGREEEEALVAHKASPTVR